ncbi:MAG: ATP synthase F0 subunit B [Crocinitomicaceae bacterium]|nr:ATP synthase F0 subunit B [Crocinitomicaceae bacterium]|tara:strand:- start:6305 stop:6799 length:495 start_codon:yes stop_codon:yes gene_type:complete
MDIVTPGIGLMFWTTLVFLFLMFILAKYAWKPILNAVKDREASINDALESAEKAKAEMAAMSADNEALLREAKAERDALMKEARDIREKMIADSKGVAKEEADKIISAARETIENEKAAAIADMKNTVSEFAIDIAEKIMRSELSSDSKQKELANQLVEDIKLN